MCRKPCARSLSTVDPLRSATPGLYYDPRFLRPAERTEILEWLRTIHPLWELRYSHLRPPPENQPQ